MTISPGSPSTQRSIDAHSLLAEDLNRLTIQERETVFEGIHGVDPVVDETEALIQKSLWKLEYELDQIDASEKTAYENALNRGPSYREYVTSREFCLMFLRCDHFDIRKAAKRLVLYFEGMLQHFGPRVLGRPLYYSDLDPDSQEYLKSGVYQLAHQARDSVGRSILVGYGLKSFLDLKRPEQWVQTLLYLYHCAIAQDETTQKRGIVVVTYVIGNPQGKMNHTAIAQLTEAQDNWLPVKQSAIHICIKNEPILRLVQPVVWLAMGSKRRQRVRMHNGTHTECMYKLMSFGIRVDAAFPISHEGALQTDIHHKWLALRQAKEQKDISTFQNELQEQQQHATEKADPIVERLIEKPEPNDVALWRGRGFQRHAGNIRMKELMEERREDYDKAPAGFKQEISREIIHVIQNTYGGRFLTQDPLSGFWVEVSEHEALFRIGKSFRSARGTAKKKKKKKNMDRAARIAGASDAGGAYVTDRIANSKRGRGQQSACCMCLDDSPALPQKMFG